MGTGGIHDLPAGLASLGCAATTSSESWWRTRPGSGGTQRRRLFFGERRAALSVSKGTSASGPTPSLRSASQGGGSSQSRPARAGMPPRPSMRGQGRGSQRRLAAAAEERQTQSASPNS